MKRIKIKFTGFEGIGGDWDDKHNWITDILSQRYEIVFSDNPEFLIFGIFGGYAHTKYDCPRIMHCSENLIPDFNVADYAISHSKLEFHDRYFYYPMCLYNHDYLAVKKKAEKVAQRNISPIDKEILKGKDIFCDFIYKHGGENQIRLEFFKELSEKYKPVASAGKLMNNMPDGRYVEDKAGFQKRCKFSIAFENTRQDGNCSEKIVDAFYANTIPIYYGDPGVKEIFNPEAFINVPDYRSWDEVIDVIRELDNDDEAYMKMLSVPAFNDPGLPLRRYRELCEFLYHIFDQEPEQAIRRSRYLYSVRYNDQLNELHTLLRVIKKNKIGSRLYKAALAYSAGGGIRGLLCKARKGNHQEKT